jgi:LmbE family N-acetylglucosaminyl deacetylase
MDQMDFQGKSIMVIGTHPDNNDFRAGATVAKASRQAPEIHYLPLPPDPTPFK